MASLCNPFISKTLDETRLWLEEMDMLLARRAQFVLVYPPVKQSKEKPSEEHMNAMKYVRRWLKHAKEPMVEHCRAMVVTLQPDGVIKKIWNKWRRYFLHFMGLKCLLNITSPQRKICYGIDFLMTMTAIG